MKLVLRILAAVAVLGFVVASVQSVQAQERVVVEERSAVVLKKVGNTVILRNDKGEIKKYTDLPEGFTLMIEGKPANEPAVDAPTAEVPSADAPPAAELATPADTTVAQDNVQDNVSPPAEPELADAPQPKAGGGA